MSRVRSWGQLVDRILGLHGWAVLAGGQPVTLAITGGTGTYRTAHGQARVVQVSETQARYTLTVIT